LGVLDKALDESVTRASGLGDAVWGDSSAQRIAQ